MRSWPTDAWCDACYRDGAGVAHPLCPMPHVDPPEGAPIPVGERMPVTRLGLLTDEPPHVCVAAGLAPAADGTLDTVYGTGVAGSPDAAAMIAIYEVLERMSLYRLPSGDVVLARAPELPAAVDPDRTDPTWWVTAGTESGDQAWLPVDWVQIDQARRAPGYRDCDSTGAAVQISEEMAVLAGRLECAERRALRQLWRTGGTPAGVGSLPDTVEPFVSALAGRGCRVELGLAESGDTVLAIGLVVDAGGERAVGGAAMDLTVEAAGYRAVAEAYGKAVGAGFGSDAPAAQVAVLTGAAVGRARARLGMSSGPAAVTWLAGNGFAADVPAEYHVGRTTPWLARHGLAAAQVVSERPLPGWEVAADDAACLFG